MQEKKQKEETQDLNKEKSELAKKVQYRYPIILLSFYLCRRAVDPWIQDPGWKQIQIQDLG